MTQLLKRDEAQAILKPLSDIEVRSFSPTDNYGFQLDGTKLQYKFGTKNQVMAVGPIAWDYAMRTAGLSPNMDGKFPKELLAPLVDHSFRNHERELSAIVQGDTLVAFGDTKFEPHDSMEVLEAAEKAVGGKKHIKGYRASGDFARQYLTIVGDKSVDIGTLVEPGTHKSVNDIVNYGVNFYNSPLGIPGYGGGAPFEVAGFLERLVCTNGAVSTMNTNRFTAKDAKGTEFAEWLTDKVSRVYAQAEVEFDRVKNLKDVPLPDHTSNALDNIFRDFGVPPFVREMVLRRNADHPAHNLFDFWNHITYVASHYRKVLENPQLVRRLMQAGGNIVEHQMICNSCGHVLRNRRQRQHDEEVHDEVEVAVA